MMPAIGPDRAGRPFPAPPQDFSLPGVLSVEGPKAPYLPLVFDSPHSGLEIPADFHPAVEVSDVLISADTHVDDLFSSAPDYGAPLLRAHFPRSFLDPNRSLLDMDLEMVCGNWPHPVGQSPTAKRGMGLMWRYCWGNTLMHAQPLSVTQAEDRIARYWQPYHRALRNLLDAAYERFGRVFHVNCHSMTATGHAMSSDGASAARPDICIGDLHGTSAGKEFVDVVAKALEGEGLSVGLNKPFRGAELARAYANPSIGRHSIQLEINRRLYMDETTRERSENYQSLKATITRLNHTLADYVA
tara:strand:- start:17887 stop:18789 length:903 start_codon:yes stop_codon:yes gene_type:complete